MKLSAMKLFSVIFFLPLVALAQEFVSHSVDKNSLAIFHVDRTISFEALEDRNWGYPWIPDIGCDPANCISINMSGGTARYTYVANEIYPADAWVRIKVLSWLDHFSNPRHIFFNLDMFVAREWKGQLYYLAGSHMWKTNTAEARTYVTNTEFLKELGVAQLVHEIDDYACESLGAPYYAADDSRGGDNIEVQLGRMCARRGVFVDDLIKEVRRRSLSPTIVE